jgi:hypothetical protein
MSQQSQASARWALLIGIDRYCRLGENAQLAGCANDVAAMAQVLVERFAFPPDHVVELVDEEATRSAILASLDALATKAAPGDAVVVHYSGHGSQAPSVDPNEADGCDETILPHDTGRDAGNPNLDIHDKEIHAWLARITAVTRNVTLIFDSCHSGGVTRDAVGARARSVPADRRPLDRRLVPPMKRTAARARGETGPSGWVPLGQRYVLLAGCASSECSYELAAPGSDGLHHGALTWALSRQLALAGEGTTYRDVFEASANQVAANCSLQHPQLEGEADRTLFGLDRIEPMRFVPVRGRTGERVLVGAGLAMGLSRGSTWAVYPAGTKRLDASAAPLGTIEVTAADGVSASAKVIGETAPGGIVPGARAVELSHDYGDLTLSVRVKTPWPSDGERLAQAVERSPVLRPAHDGEAAGVTVYLLPPRQQAGERDPVPQVALVHEPTWAAVGPGGELVVPLSRDVRGVPAEMVGNLERRARYLAALAIQNPATRLRGAIDCVLLRRSDDGEWVPAAAAPGGLPDFTDGEPLAFDLVNRSRLPLYFCVLDFGLTGRIGPLYPLPGIDEPLRAGGSIRIGADPDELMELTMPEDYPYLAPASPADLIGLAGRETLKVIATTRPADFHLLYQDGYLSPAKRGALTALDRLLGIAAGSEATRDVRVKSRPDEDDWTALERSFWLRG